MYTLGLLGLEGEAHETEADGLCQRASPLAPVGAGDAGQCPGAASHLEAYRRLNREGLAINDPKQLHQLRLYDGVQLLLPGQDAGIDLAREYALAKGIAGGGGKTP